MGLSTPSSSTYVVPVPNVPLFGKYSANGTSVGQSPTCSSRVVVSRSVQTSSLLAGENTGTLCDQGRMEGRVKSRQGVPGSYVHRKRAPIRGNCKIRTHREVFPCGPSSTACSSLHSACYLLLPFLVLSDLLSVWRRPRTPPREWGERDEMVYRGISQSTSLSTRNGMCLERIFCVLASISSSA